MPGSLRKMPVWLPIVILLVAMASIQSGASLAKSLFPLVGAPGVTALRLALGTLILIAFFKPWRLRFAKEQRLPLLFYGVSLGGDELSFFIFLFRRYRWVLRWRWSSPDHWRWRCSLLVAR